MTTTPFVHTDPAADLMARFPFSIGDLKNPTKLNATLFISACGLTKSGNHASATLRFDGQADSPHRIQVLLDKEYAADLTPGTRFVNPTLAKAVRPVEGGDPAKPVFEAIEPNQKETPGGTRVYWLAYMLDCDNVILTKPVLNVMGELLRKAAAAQNAVTEPAVSE